MTFEEVSKQIKSRQFAPLYLLHGEEAYYIDAIVKQAAETILNEGERDFNQTVYYAKETPAATVVDTAMRLPMMSEYQLVIVKEAQDYKNASQWEAFEKYFENPNAATILIFAYKYKKFDGRSKMYKLLKKNGVVFESQGVKDYQLTGWIRDYVKKSKFTITDKAVELLAEFIGNDLSRVVKEVEKLKIVVPSGTEINEQHIEKNIGISKDYNVFELTNAVLEKDVMKANKIIKYFGDNPKATHITVVLANLHTLYQRLFQAHFVKTANPQQLASVLKIHSYPAGQILKFKNRHPAKMISRNFSILREYDLMGKGVGNSNVPQEELMRELIYKLLH